MSPIEPRDEAVFEAARQLPAAERGAYLDQTCAGNPDLRRRVEGLLGAFERAGGFMKQPAMPSPQEREAALFTLALAEPAAARPAFLEAWCQGDAALRQRLEARLAAHDAPEAVASKEAPTVETTVKLDLPETPAEAVGQTLGRYKLLEKIGEGGCGTVYVAEQEKPVRRRVALKVIKLGMDTREVIARFEAERQALAMMDHPHIAKVLDAGTTQAGRPYFVMELVRGIRITDYCDQAHLSTKERLDLFIKVCQAIQHAHQKGIIHRDIKPSNILVTLHDGVAVPKVIDFGIAKATEGRLTEATVYTQLHQFLGTPAYMSPEQAEMTGLDIDTRSDIYSLGVLLYQLLTSQTPFDGKELLASGLDAMRKTIREKEPMRPSTRLAELKGDELTTTAKRRSVASAKLLHQLQGDLDCIVMKALEKERTRRYDTANGFAMDLQRFLSNEPVVARPPSTAYRLQKFIGRNKGMVGAAVVVAAALVVGILGSTWQAVRATRAETAARRNFYIADMHLAQQAWEQNNIEQLRQLLEETAMYPGRGLEWYYWQRQLHLEMMTLRGHLYGVLAVAFSPNGQRIVTCSYDKTAKVWEAATGKELLTLKGHSAWVISLAFSPDGQRIVTGSADQTAKVWEAATGKELLTLKGHSAHIRSVAFSPNGHRIVTGSSDATAKVWDAATGTELLTLKGHDGTIRSVAFSPDGLRIVTGSRDNTAKVWEAATGKELFPLKGHTNAIFSVAFSPDGHRIATGSGDATVKVWEAGSGRELLTCKGHSAEIGSVAFSPDGQRIVSGSIDRARPRNAGFNTG